jgi:hypothetical protein
MDELGDLMEALRLVLEDSRFPRLRSGSPAGLAGLLAVLRGGRGQDGALVYDSLRQIQETAPYKLTGLYEILQKPGALSGLKGMRDGKAWYMIATAPRILPNLLAALALLKFSSREAQWSAYAMAWVIQAAGLCAVVGWLAPMLVPGLIVWCVGSEVLHSQLDFEEVMTFVCPFSILRACSKMEYVLELCQEKGVELGRLLEVSEQFVREGGMGRPRRRSSRQQGSSRSPRVNLLGDR